MIDPIVVTGIGVVSPAGIGIENFWSSVIDGRPSCSVNDLFPLAMNTSRAVGLIRNFAPESSFSISRPVTPLEHDRLCIIARAAIDEAVESAGLSNLQGCSFLDETALYISSAIGPMASMEKVISSRCSGGDVYDGVNSFLLSNFILHLVRHTRIGGAYALIPTGCTGGCDALGYAMAAIRDGVTRRAIVGSFDAPITPMVVAAFARINATSNRDCPAEEASAPFQLDRDGFVLGEGGGALVIESLSAALERKAQPLAVIAGYGSVNSAFHMTDIEPSGKPIVRSILTALKDATLQAEDIDHINLHGSSTLQNDIAETNAVMEVFGNRGSRIPVSSLKSQIGHALSASNSMELIAGVLSLRQGVIFPTINQRNRDPDCNLNIVQKAEYGTINHILKTASGFSGIHSAVVLSRYEA
ncbi:beta-ketoacyl-[acyl-carrier-protein] synthase family protein [Acetobacteraceae bacterium ESL0709]|nr:beta-ketoacyl-[acyl-carrier-protein] synthase family protein [Acetobacteraceae bacterium ESL0697]MDF7679065.1 beta-ketoacyl-[acyl-carrier-protein] synthase family protein [Acetobacteraceae bacterium ESL0709]